MSITVAYATMWYMEIAILQNNSLKLKGKKATFVVDPQDKTARSAVIVLTKSDGDLSINAEDVIINGPGEYELGGVKISCMRSAGAIVYTLNIDGVEILLGKISSYEKLQHKLNDQNIVIAYADSQINASFITSLASNVVIFYGDLAPSVAESFGKGNVKQMPKYTATMDKLPAEVETVILE